MTQTSTTERRIHAASQAEKVFSSPHLHLDEPRANDKLAGDGDSVRGQHSARKAPGGHDAARSRDGG